MIDFDQLERQAKAIDAAMPSIKLVLDRWYETLNATIAATQNFTRLIEQFSREEHMTMSTWEGEGGSLEREVYS